MVNAKENSQPLVTALLRGLAVLRCFSYGNESLGSSEIARLLHLPQPTVWRLCKTLESEGYLVADGDGTRYRPGLAVLTLGYAALSTMDIAALSAPLLLQQSKQVRGTAGLSTREGLSMLFLQRCEARDAVLNLNLRVGSRVPLATSVTGWAHLAMLEATEQNHLLAELEKADPVQMKTAGGSLHEALTLYQEKGYIINDGVFFPGLTSIAVPFRATKRGGIFVVSCSAMTSVFGSQEQHHQAGLALRHIASQLSEV